MTREQTTIELAESLLSEIDEEAEEQQLSRSEYIRQLLESRQEADEIKELIAKQFSKLEDVHEQLNFRKQQIARLDEQLDKRILDSNSKQDACDFCGTVAETNSLIDHTPVAEHQHVSPSASIPQDGPQSASIPRTVVCYDCAHYVSDYLKTRAGNVDQDGTNSSPFEEADAEALLDRLKENESLVLVPEKEHEYCIRFVDGEWIHAHYGTIRDGIVDTHSRDEIRDIVINTNRLTLRKLDPSSWDQFTKNIQPFDAFDDTMFNNSG